MVGERLDELGIGEIVGVDLLAEARDAARRDRPASTRTTTRWISRTCIPSTATCSSATASTS